MGHAELGGGAVVPAQVADANRRGRGRGMEAELVVAEGERGAREKDFKWYMTAYKAKVEVDRQ